MTFNATPLSRARMARCLIAATVIALLGLGDAIPVAAQDPSALTVAVPVSTLVKVADNATPLELLTSPDGVDHLLTDAGLYTNAGGAWRLDAPPVKPADIAMDSAGHLFAVAVASGTMTVATNTAGTWASETVTGFDGTQCVPAIALGQNDGVAILCPTMQRVELYRKTAGTWSGPEIVAGPGTIVAGSPVAPFNCLGQGDDVAWFGPAAVFDAADFLHVFIGGNRNVVGNCDPSAQGVMVDLVAGSGGWTATALPIPLYVTIAAALDTAGLIHLTSELDQGGCVYETNASGSWTSIPAPADALGSCSIAVGSSGTVLLYDSAGVTGSSGLRRAVHSASGWTITRLTEVAGDRRPEGSFNAAGTLRVAFLRGGATWVLTGPGPVAPTAAIAPLPAVTPSSSLTLHWGASQGTSPIASYDVQVRTAPWYGSFGGYAWLRAATTSSRATISVAAGRTYCFRSRARDTHGLLSAWTAETCTAVPLDDRALARSSGWSAGLSSRYYRGTYLATSRYGATLVRTGVVARRLSLVATTCPVCGAVRVYLGSTLLRTISLYSPTTMYRRVLDVATFSSARSGTVTVRVTSSRRPVYIDGLAVRRN